MFAILNDVFAAIQGDVFAANQDDVFAIGGDVFAFWVMCLRKLR